MLWNYLWLLYFLLQQTELPIKLKLFFSFNSYLQFVIHYWPCKVIVYVKLRKKPLPPPLKWAGRFGCKKEKRKKNSIIHGDNTSIKMMFIWLFVPPLLKPMGGGSQLGTTGLEYCNRGAESFMNFEQVLFFTKQFWIFSKTFITCIPTKSPTTFVTNPWNGYEMLIEMLNVMWLNYLKPNTFLSKIVVT